MTNNISEMISSAMERMQKMVDVNSIIGNPLQVGDGVTVIPITKLHIGVGGGGTDFATKSSIASKKDPVGGGLGAGVSVDPVAFLIVKDGSVRMIPVAEPASTTMDRIVEQAPDLMDKVADFLDSRKEKSEA